MLFKLREGMIYVYVCKYNGFLKINEQALSQKVYQDKIIQYYRECNNAYRDAWSLDKNMQLNLGLWKDGCKSLSQALNHLNREVAEKAEISKNHHVLDAGCGVGGTAIFLGQNYGCKVKGITLSPEQAKRANENAKKFKLQDQCSFEVMDFMNTGYPDEQFDIILGIESICYAEPKIDFLREAKRLLKPGGRLVLAENLQAKADLNQQEYKILYEDAFHGCQVQSLDTAEQYQSNLSKVGFQSIQCLDYTEFIRPSINRLRRFYFPAKLYNLFYRSIGKPFSSVQESNTKMCYYLKSSLDQGLWKYALISAKK